MRYFLLFLYLWTGVIIVAERDNRKGRLAVRLLAALLGIPMWPAFFVARLYVRMGK